MRFFLLLIAGLFCGINSRWACAQPVSTQPAQRPNIIIILADDLGYSDLGCFGGEVHTPNLDALAHDGVRFTSFYNNARCCPTRASLLTGLYPHQAGVGAMTQSTPLPGYAGRIKPTAPTIAEVLKASGYKTAMFGKWHVSNTIERADHMKDLNRLRFPDLFSPIEQYPTRRGFEEFWGVIWGVVDYFNPFSLVDGEKPVTSLPTDFYITDTINQHATEYIQRQAKSTHPFFIYLAHNAPHWPLHARPEDVEKYRNQYNEGFDAIRKARYQRMIEMGILDPQTARLSPTVGRNDWNNFTPEEKRFQAGLFQAHAAMIDRMDQGLGDVFRSLKETGKWENTLIVFLSDNGASAERYEDAGFDRPTVARDGTAIRYHYDDLNQLAGPEQTFYYIGRNWANVANTPYRKAKASQYNGGSRTPFIAHWPAGLKPPAGSFVRATAHVIDIMPTAMALANASMPDPFAGKQPRALQGQSLLPLLMGLERPDHPPLFGEHEGGRSVITPDGWKLVRDKGDNDWQLFDLNTDQTEMVSLTSSYPERVKKMQAMWDAWAKSNDVQSKP